MAIIEKFESPMERGKLSAAPIATPDQIGAARHLENIEFKKTKELRERGDQARIKELKAEIQSQFPKIELNDSGATLSKGRRGGVLAAEHAWANEKPKAKSFMRPMVPPLPTKRSWFDRIVGRDQ